MAFDFERRYNKPIVCKVVQPVCAELVQISKVAEEREKELKKSISKKCDQLLQQLNIDYDSDLSIRDVNLMLELMGIELNMYQRAELNVTITRAHSYKIKSFKDWMFKNRNFILCKLVGKSSEDLHKTKASNLTLPAINNRSRSTTRVQTNVDYTKLLKKHKEIKVKFTQELEKLYNENKKMKRDPKGKKVLERLNKSMKEQKRTFAKNAELLSLIQKYSTQMNLL